MKLKDYLNKRQEVKQKETFFRDVCPQCRFSLKTCYCHKIKRFDPKITFVILIHQYEIDRKIATGRLSHLIMENSVLIPGYDYSEDASVNRILNNAQNFCIVLYPGENSTNLSLCSSEERKKLFPQDKNLVIFVIDGTWRTAGQTMRLSRNLSTLPRFSFTRETESHFRVRKQPKEGYCSTVEAIHQTIELLGQGRGFDLARRKHDNLLEVFDYMVDQQLDFMKKE